MKQQILFLVSDRSHVRKNEMLKILYQSTIASFIIRDRSRRSIYVCLKLFICKQILGNTLFPSTLGNQWTTKRTRRNVKKIIINFILVQFFKCLSSCLSINGTVYVSDFMSVWKSLRKCVRVHTYCYSAWKK